MTMNILNELIMNELAGKSELLSLISEKNMSTSEDGTIRFNNDNGSLTFKETENGCSINFEYTPKVDWHQILVDYCEQIEDDDFFNEACELYTNTFGNLKELNDNTTEQGIRNFVKCVQDVAIEKIKEYSVYAELNYKG